MHALWSNMDEGGREKGGRERKVRGRKGGQGGGRGEEGRTDCGDDFKSM